MARTTAAAPACTRCYTAACRSAPRGTARRGWRDLQRFLRQRATIACSTQISWPSQRAGFGKLDYAAGCVFEKVRVLQTLFSVAVTRALAAACTCLAHARARTRQRRLSSLFFIRCPISILHVFLRQFSSILSKTK